MEYKTSLDTAAKVITGLISAMFLTLTIYNFSLIGLESSWRNVGALIFTTSLVVIVYAICFLYRPTKYVIANGRLTVKRPIKDFSIDIQSIKSTTIADKDSMKWTIRTFGNGGLFGYFGKFYNAAFGKMTWYATRRNNYLVLSTSENGKIVLTPDNLEMAKEIERLTQV